jgi:hypothetical protein
MDIPFKACRKKPITVHAAQMDEDFAVETLEGVLSGKKGDYLMRGAQGEFYPIKKEIFETTYDWVNE